MPQPNFDAPPPAPQAQPAEVPAPERKVERPSPLTGIANAWFAIIAVIVVIGREFIEQDVGLDAQDGGVIALVVLGAVLVVALIGLAVGFLQWRITTFIVDDEFRIEKRFLSTSTTRIDFTKVQSVDITRPLVARLLGLAEVKIDVGGEGGQSLRYLTKERANSLRDTLLARMEHDVPVTPDGAPAEQQSVADDAVDVYRANPVNIAVGSVLSFGLFGFVLLAVVLTLFFGPFGALAGLGWLWLAMLGAVWQIPNHLLTNWGFAIRRTSKGYRIQRGALTRVQTTLRANRVQTVSISQSLFMRWAGLYTVKISVLGNSTGGEESNDGIDVLVPFGKIDEVRHVIGLIWPDVDPTALQWTPQSPRGRWLTWFAQHWYAVDEQVIAAKQTMLGNHVHLVPHIRVQGLEVNEGPLQRALKLGTVQVQTIDAAPDVPIEHLDRPTVRALFDEELRRSADARQRPESTVPAPPVDPDWAPPAWPEEPASPPSDSGPR